MSMKVKRGLGLVVIAVLAWLLQQALGANSPQLVEAVLLIGAVLCLFVGLALLAWGLLAE